MILRDMGMLTESQAHSQLMTELWSNLNRQSNDSVNLQHLKVFMCAIMNFDVPWMKVKVEAAAPQTDEDAAVAE